MPTKKSIKIMYDAKSLHNSRLCVVMVHLLVGVFLWPMDLRAVVSHCAQPKALVAYDQQHDAVLDNYEAIASFYACDPIKHIWIQIKCFTVLSLNYSYIYGDFDWEPYRKFWAYDPSAQEWRRVSLVPYLKQHLGTPKQNAAHNPQCIPPGELLEELLVKSEGSVCQIKNKIWSHISLHSRLGSGLVFYENSLPNWSLYQGEQKGDFFITHANRQAYQPNWFYSTFDQLNDASIAQLIPVKSTDVLKFRGKGWAWPIALELQYAFDLPFFVGFGREVIFNSIAMFTHNDPSKSNNRLIVNNKWSMQGRWFVKGGYCLWCLEQCTLSLDFQLFYIHHLGNRFWRIITFTPYIRRALAYNIGLGYTQKITPHLSYTARCSFEFQSFRQFPRAVVYNIRYKQPAIYMQVGLSWQCAKASMSHPRRSGC